MPTLSEAKGLCWGFFEILRCAQNDRKGRPTKSDGGGTPANPAFFKHPQPYVKNDKIWFCPSESRPSVWEQDGFSTGDPSYRGAGTSYAYKSIFVKSEYTEAPEGSPFPPSVP